MVIECYIYEKDAPSTALEAQRVAARGGIIGQSTNDIWPQLPDSLAELEFLVGGAWLEQCIGSFAFEVLSDGAAGVTVNLTKSVSRIEPGEPFDMLTRKALFMQNFGEPLQPFIDAGKFKFIPDDE